MKAAGGRIIVSPDTNIEVIAAAAEAGLVSCPGLFYAVRGIRRARAGAHALKLFPAEAASPAVLKAQRAVIPKDVPVMVVGGVAPDNMQPWIDAGAAGFGLGSGSTSPAKRPRRRSTKRAPMSPELGRVKPIKIAIIGFGKIAADQHVPSIAGQSALRAGRDARAARAKASARPSPTGAS